MKEEKQHIIERLNQSYREQERLRDLMKSPVSIKFSNMPDTRQYDENGKGLRQATDKIIRFLEIRPSFEEEKDLKRLIIKYYQDKRVDELTQIEGKIKEDEEHLKKYL